MLEMRVKSNRIEGFTGGERIDCAIAEIDRDLTKISDLKSSL